MTNPFYTEPPTFEGFEITDQELETLQEEGYEVDTPAPILFDLYEPSSDVIQAIQITKANYVSLRRAWPTLMESAEVGDLLVRSTKTVGSRVFVLKKRAFEELFTYRYI